MKNIKLRTIILLSGILSIPGLNANNVKQSNNNVMETLNLTQEWDKTFPKSDKIDHCKVTFINRYGITLAADMYKYHRQAKCHRRVRTIRCSQGTVLRTLCTGDG